MHMGILCDGQGKNKPNHQKITKQTRKEIEAKELHQNCQQSAQLSPYASTVGLCLQNLMIYLEF